MKNDQDIASGARQVEATQHMTSGLTEVQDPALHEDGLKGESGTTMLGDLTLSMFQQGQTVRVRVGSATAAAEFYEFAYESAEEANTALLDAGVLTKAHVKDMSKPAGTGIHISGVTAQQLTHAGLKKHTIATL